MFFSYAKDVVFSENTSEDAQKLTTNGKHTIICIVRVNSFKTKVMVLKTQNKDKPNIAYNNEPLQIVKHFRIC